jgi:hypothetical protein
MQVVCSAIKLAAAAAWRLSEPYVGQTQHSITECITKKSLADVEPTAPSLSQHQVVSLVQFKLAQLELHQYV